MFLPPNMYQWGAETNQYVIYYAYVGETGGRLEVDKTYPQFLPCYKTV